MIDVARENDIERLRQIVTLLQVENDRLHKRLRELTERDPEKYQLEIASLKEQIDRQQRALFGRSSERRDGGGTQREKDKKLRSGHGPSEQPTLPIVEVPHELEGSDRNCPKCGHEMDEMAGQAETSDEIDVVEREFRILRHVRKKYRCRCGSHIETALGPARLIPGGRYSVDFAIMVASEKYLQHMPLARQERAMRWQGLSVTRSALWDQLVALSGHLEPTYEAIRRHVLDAPVIGADETTWPLLEKGAPKKWWAWALTSEDAVYYRIASGRSSAVAVELLGEYEGAVVCDGYSVYPAALERIAEERAGPAPFRLANCWSHARRKFVKAEPSHPEAAEAIELIGQLFEVEREAALTGPRCQGSCRLG